MVSLLFAADDGRDRSRLLYGTRNATSALNHLPSASLRDDEILRSFSLSSLSSLFLFLLLYADRRRPAVLLYSGRFRGIAHCQKEPPGSLLPGRLSR